MKSPAMKGAIMLSGALLAGTVAVAVRAPLDARAQDRSRTTAEAQGAVRVVDHCCYDLDGGGQADDGLLIVARGGEEVITAVMYEDPDKNKKFDTADRVLAVLVPR